MFFCLETTSSQTGVVAGSVGGALVLVTIVLILGIFAHRRYTCIIGNIWYHPWWFSMVVILRRLVKIFIISTLKICFDMILQQYISIYLFWKVLSFNILFDIRPSLSIVVNNWKLQRYSKSICNFSKWRS